MLRRAVNKLMVMWFYFLYKFAAKLTEIVFFLIELACFSLSRAMLSDFLGDSLPHAFHNA